MIQLYNNRLECSVLFEFDYGDRICFAYISDQESPMFSYTRLNYGVPFISQYLLDLIEENLVFD